MAAANHRYRHKKGIPALGPLSLILEMGDTHMTGWMGFLIKPFFRLIAKRARKKAWGRVRGAWRINLQVSLFI